MLIDERPFTIDDDKIHSLKREIAVVDDQMSSLSQGSSFFHPVDKKNRLKVKIFPKTDDDYDNQKVEKKPFSSGERFDVKTFANEDMK